MSLAVRTIVLGFLVSACWSRVAHAENQAIRAGDISLGQQISGQPLGAGDLAGRVVVLEFWGVNCPPCIASMPDLEKLHQQLSPDGLLVIGAHAQGGPADEVRKVVTELGVTFPIVENATVDGGMDFGGIPHCMVFDHTGACVYRGHPGRAHDAVVAAVQAAPGAVLGGQTLVKLAAVGQMLKNEAQWGAALKKVKPLVDSGDEETAKEARFVIERVEGRGQEMLDKARDLADADPLGAATLAQQCSVVFKGTDLGKEATKVLVEWKKDKAFQAAVKAGQQLARLEALQAAARNAPGGVPRQAVSQAREIAKSIEKSCPGSDYSAKAAAIVAALATEPAA